MSTNTNNLGLTKLADGENFANSTLNTNWEKIDTALGSKQYNLGVLSSSTIADQAIAFATAHRGEANFVGSFYISASAIPSDLPAQTNEWKYSYGFFRVRISPLSGGADGEIVLFGFNTSNIAIRHFGNGTVAGSWTIMPPKNDYATKTTAWLAAEERTDGAASCIVQTYGKMAVLTITTSSRAHAEDDALGTIESGLRPIATTFGPCYAGGQAGWIRITTDGQIKIWLLPSGTAASRIYTTVTYVMA